MRNESALASSLDARRRVVFVHFEGQRRFFGRSRHEHRREVTVTEIEALASAGFDIVEVNMCGGKPLCALLGPADR